MIASLLAINNFLLFFIIIKVGNRPASPGIAETVMSFFLLKLKFLKLFKILFFDNFFFTFKYIYGSLTTKKIWFIIFYLFTNEIKIFIC